MGTAWSTSPTGTTGRALVLFQEGSEDSAAQGLSDVLGATIEQTDSSGGPVSGAAIAQCDGLVFSDLGVAIVAADDDQLEALTAPDAAVEGVVAVEPERTVYAQGDDPRGVAPEPVIRMLDYARGMHDAAEALMRAAGASAPSPARFDESQVTWGLQAVGVPTSPLTGSGVALAILDTGIDLTHPDFDSRRITSESFIDREEIQDANGHGTHCIGTACGPATAVDGPRYGVAPAAQIFAGKVLSDRGSGSDAGILAGIEWAIRSGCQIVSMSLGAPVSEGQPHSQIFETVARRALRRNTLIVAAAGNDSNRASGRVAPVSHPANCPSILAVGAVDSGLAIADFSNRGDEQSGGQLDFVGPGVDVHSAWPMPRGTRRISGTSMACPHVAGILALFAQANPRARSDELVALAFKGARRLSLASFDAGAGLVQAP